MRTTLFATIFSISAGCWNLTSGKSISVSQSFQNKIGAIRPGDYENAERSFFLHSQPKPALKSESGSTQKRVNTISFHRFNLRFGFGYTIADSSMNGLPAILKNIRSSWQVKTDFLYKPGAQQNALNDVRKGHGFGVFMTYGRQSAANAGRILGETNSVNTNKPSRGFLEIETGMMLREEFRISGGAGFMNYYQVSEIQQERASKAYYCFTAGVSPRLLPFLELDLNLGGVVINGDVKPRASVSAVLLLQAK
jgi:hypothetical protein